MVKAKAGYATVPRIMDGGTIAVLGSGPSLSRADVELCRPLDGVVAVNDAYTLAPWATALYAGDRKWWHWHKGVPGFLGRRYTVQAYPGVEVLRQGPDTGLCLDPTRLALGRNSVYQAINLAVHFGATRILLLGVDMSNGPRADGKGRSDHFFGHHPDNSAPQFSICLARFETLVQPLAKAGVEVLNCSRRTALDVFPRVALEEALGLAAAVSA